MENLDGAQGVFRWFGGLLLGVMVSVPAWGRWSFAPPALDFTRPIVLGGEVVTLGFEVEFTDGAEARSVLNLDNENVRTTKFPYLLPAYKIEKATGRFETNSIPVNSLVPLERQLREQKEVLGGSVKSVHVHFRVSPKVVDQIGEEKFGAWISRIADAIIFWRLENRSPFIVFGTLTLGRLVPMQLEDRGALRVERKEGMVDIEVRGLDGDVQETIEFVKLILTGLAHPELIVGYSSFQESTFNGWTISQLVGHYIQSTEGRSITSEEQTVLILLEDLRYRILPPEFLSYAPYLSAEERSAVVTAEKVLVSKISNIVQQAATQQEPLVRGEVRKAYADVVRQWAQHLQLSRKLRSTLLSSPGTPETSTLSESEAVAVLKQSPMATHDFIPREVYSNVSVRSLLEILGQATAPSQYTGYIAAMVVSRMNNISLDEQNDLLDLRSDLVDQLWSILSESKFKNEVVSISEKMWERSDRTGRLILARLILKYGVLSPGLLSEIRRSGPQFLAILKEGLLKMWTSRLVQLLTMDFDDQQTRGLVLGAMTDRAAGLSAQGLLNLLSRCMPSCPAGELVKKVVWTSEKVREMNVGLFRDLDRPSGSRNLAYSATALLALEPFQTLDLFSLFLRHPDSSVRAEARRLIPSAPVVLQHQILESFPLFSVRGWFERLRSHFSKVCENLLTNS